jgi:hypothetical protein
MSRNRASAENGWSEREGECEHIRGYELYREYRSEYIERGGIEWR